MQNIANNISLNFAINVVEYLIGLCIGQVFTIRYDTIRLIAISNLLDEQFV